MALWTPSKKKKLHGAVLRAKVNSFFFFFRKLLAAARRVIVVPAMTAYGSLDPKQEKKVTWGCLVSKSQLFREFLAAARRE
jgi:hypothetical protein